MAADWTDFQTMWEQRFLEVAEPFLNPKPELVEGTGLARYADGTTLAVVVSPGDEFIPRSGFYNCEIVAELEFSSTDDSEDISRLWGQVLDAFGNGADNTDPLRDRLAAGRLTIPGGLHSIQYDRQLTNDPEQHLKQFVFSAVLGILPPN